jgi:hypothetical protein
MKIIIALLLFFIYSGLQGQDLKNTEWIKIKAERKDGSKIIDRLRQGNESIEYYFTVDSVFTSTNEQHSLEQKYSINNNNNILAIGDFVNYKIDSLNEVFLGITEMPQQDLADDKLNSFVFINSDFIFDYLKQTHQLTIIEDSVVVCDNKFSPIFKGDIEKLFESQFKSAFSNKLLTGSFIISSSGDIRKVQIDTIGKFSKGEIGKIISAINLTRGSWILPPTPTPMSFKITFAIKFKAIPPLFSIQFIFYPKDHASGKGLTSQEEDELSNHFNNGLRLFNKDKFEKAVDEFEKCIEIDSLYIDAYYDMAYSYQKLGNTALACQTWKKLKDMGQKGGEKFYNENCK